MQRRDLVRMLETAGFVPVGGTNHEHFEKDGLTVIIPRHREINELTAKGILKRAGLK